MQGADIRRWRTSPPRLASLATPSVSSGAPGTKTFSSRCVGEDLDACGPDIFYSCGRALQERATRSATLEPALAQGRLALEEDSNSTVNYTCSKLEADECDYRSGGSEFRRWRVTPCQYQAWSLVTVDGEPEGTPLGLPICAFPWGVENGVHGLELLTWEQDSWNAQCRYAGSNFNATEGAHIPCWVWTNSEGISRIALAQDMLERLKERSAMPAAFALSSFIFIAFIAFWAWFRLPARDMRLLATSMPLPLLVIIVALDPLDAWAAYDGYLAAACRSRGFLNKSIYGYTAVAVVVLLVGAVDYTSKRKGSSWIALATLAAIFSQGVVPLDYDDREGQAAYAVMWDVALACLITLPFSYKAGDWPCWRPPGPPPPPASPTYFTRTSWTRGGEIRSHSPSPTEIARGNAMHRQLLDEWREANPGVPFPRT